MNQTKQAIVSYTSTIIASKMFLVICKFSLQSIVT